MLALPSALIIIVGRVSLLPLLALVLVPIGRSLIRLLLRLSAIISGPQYCNSWHHFSYATARFVALPTRTLNDVIVSVHAIACTTGFRRTVELCLSARLDWLVG